MLPGIFKCVQYIRAISATITLFWGMLLVFLSPFIIVMRVIALMKQMKHANAIIASEEQFIQEMRDYFAYTQSLEQNKGVDLDILTAQGGVLFENSYAKAVLSKGESAAQDGLRKKIEQFGPNGEILRGYNTG